MWSTLQVITPTHAKASEMQDIAHRQVGGGTDFGSAFAKCRELMSRCSRAQDGRPLPTFYLSSSSRKHKKKGTKEGRTYC